MILDTNALSRWSEGGDVIATHLSQGKDLIVPVVVLGEYYFGVARSRHQAALREWLRRVLRIVKIANISHQTAVTYGQIRAELRVAGTPIPANDVWIAAIARQKSLPILSNDAHFDHVKGIRRIGF